MNRGEDLPTRFLGLLFVRELYELAKLAIHRYDMDIDELMIVCCVVSESTRDLLEEIYLSKEFGYEPKVLPTAERHPVSLKSIHTALNMSRETARRKLLRLVDRGFLIRAKEGYIFPAQSGEHDYTAELRRALAHNAARFMKHLERLR